MENLRQRAQRAAERILENESLTSNLDDNAAQVLLDWGLRCAEQIARDTFGLSDELAEEAMYPRMRALRRLLRAVNRWAPMRQPMDVDTLNKLLAHAAVVYEGYTPPGSMRQAIFLRQGLAGSMTEAIAQLRAFVEPRDTGPQQNREGEP
jgi:hypothetical protein